jgi:hypothetical protein
MSAGHVAVFDSHVDGIPCRVGVLSYLNVPGSFSFNAPSDIDYYGYFECEWEVLDRRGRPAAWLERKLRSRDRERIECEVREHFDHLRDSADCDY